MKIDKICEVCSKPYVADRRNARFCSNECYIIGHKKRERDRHREKMAAKAEKKAAEAKKKPIWQLNEEARQLGLTYGQYQALIYRQTKGI